MSIVYRERERERDRGRDRYDEPSSFASAQRSGNYTTTKSYRVRDEDVIPSNYDAKRYAAQLRDKDLFKQIEETRVVRRDREEPEPRPEPSSSRWERAPPSDSRWQDDIVIRRSKDTEEQPPRREYRREEPPSSADRELVIMRTTDRGGYERNERDYPTERYDDRRREYRDYEMVSPQRDNFGDVQRYSRTAEYYAPAPTPQTIVIRNEPIIIREKVKDDDFAVIHRSEVEDRQVSRPAPSPNKEDFFYEKTVEKRDSRPVEREEDFYARKEVRDVSPHDSVSQLGAARRPRSRGRSRHSDSDESLVYVRKEVKEGKDRRGSSSRSESPGHRRHLAEGALAGFGAAELMRHHKKSTGQETSGPVRRLGKDVGAGVLGAVAASGLTKAKHEVSEHISEFRSKSRGRGRSVSYEREDRREDRREERRSRRDQSRSRSHSRSRSRSHSRIKKIGGFGLAAAAAATATAVAVAAKKKKDRDASLERHGRGRHRRGSSSSSSASSSSSLSGSDADDARNPKHRKTRMAEAGAAGAAVAGLIEGARSRSRKRKGERSRSRVRTGLPIAAAGLGSAAIAGIYERNKAQREMESAAVAARTRSRSRSRARSAYGDGHDGGINGPDLIQYGAGPMQGQIPQADYYGQRAHSHDGYYSDAMVPVGAAGLAGAAAAAGHGSRSHHRHHHGHAQHRSSSESSDGGKRHRRRGHSRGQSRDVATPAIAAIGGGLAANEYAKRKEKKKDKARRRKCAAGGGGGGDVPSSRAWLSPC